MSAQQIYDNFAIGVDLGGIQHAADCTTLFQARHVRFLARMLRS
ncbi:hypothetical protein ATK30_0322 [Amycolatopsis echigonensis]|uniref:Uncharacterized protein n=1 Tax=Amycolatopsis echigonensis TaxID=2576905 RepID=A0A2N3X283_9PSEU|nr:hypothetical protein ATK30_0322 [Amycolatopsis niigatensis]